MAGPVLDKTTQMFVDWQPIEVRFGLVRDGHIDCMPAARSKRHLETLGTRLNACLVQRDVKTGLRLLEDHFKPGVVLDPLGGDAFDAALRALAWRGRLVVIGFASGRIPEVKANYLLVKNIEVTGLQVSDYRKRMPELMTKCIREIFALYREGKLKPAPFRTVPLEAFATALQDIVDRRASGRIVLEPNP